MNRRRLMTGLAALPLAPSTLAACATTGGGDGAAPLRVATFNIWHNQGDLAARQPLMIEALRRIDADVIGLQEVLQDPAVDLPNQARTLADALGGYQVRFVSTDPENAPRRYGNAVLSRLPILSDDSRRLEPLDDYRTALRVRVVHGGRPVEVVCTHLAAAGDQGPVRARQVADLLAWLGPVSPDAPRVILGDFNARLTDPELAAITAAGFVTALPVGAIDTTLIAARGHTPRVIDHIYVQGDAVTARSAARFADQATGGEYPSDHFGVTADLSLR